MRINGTIDFIELEDLKNLLDRIFESDKVEHKIRIFGDDFKIINEQYEIYIGTFDVIKMIKPRFSIEGNIKMSLKDSLREIHRITNLIRSQDVEYCITIYPIDNDENIDIELRSLHYYEQYEKMKIKDGS